MLAKQFMPLHSKTWAMGAVMAASLVKRRATARKMAPGVTSRMLT
jgi:hypothetical protein